VVCEIKYAFIRSHNMKILRTLTENIKKNNFFFQIPGINSDCLVISNVTHVLCFGL